MSWRRDETDCPHNGPINTSIRTHREFLILYFLIIQWFVGEAWLHDGGLLAQSATSTDYRSQFVQQGFWMKILMNDHGLMGSDGVAPAPRIGLVYPLDSPFEHIAGMGLWIGAIVDTGSRDQRRSVKLVTQTDETDASDDTAVGETFPIDLVHPFYHTSVFNIGEPNRRGFDDDNDGKVDEDPLDGTDNDGDGKIDEDYGAVSESDYYWEYADTAADLPPGQRHYPLGIKIRQCSYAWGNALREPILPFDYILTNIGKNQLKNVYIGLDIGPHVGSRRRDELDRNFAGYWPEIFTAYVQNPIDEGTTPIGFTILSPPRPLTASGLKFYFLWDYATFSRLPDVRCDWNINSNKCRYDFLSGVPYANSWGPIRPDQSPTELSNVDLLLSFGPIENWAPGDTLRLSFAVVSGHTLRYGPDNLYDNAQLAQTLYQRGYIPPLILPAPKLNLEIGSRKVTLSWGNTGTSTDPRNIWDEANNIVQFYPPDHWRRRNPPTGVTTGGRIFEGFRLYRSEDPSGIPGSFTLLKQWDVIDSVGPRYEYDVGIETTYVDSNLNTNKTYWYAMTSFGIPDLHTIDYVDRDGTVKVETLFTKSAEISVLASRKRVNIPFSVSTNVGEVKVVPNPYRVDEDYTYESGGWEGRARSWTEDKRVIKFIHLPPTCTIRIFTIAGDLVTTLYHENPIRGELNWNLISESGRAIASGVYIFTVESDLGKQMGKFAVIR